MVLMENERPIWFFMFDKPVILLKVWYPYCPVLVMKDRGVQNDSLHLHAHVDYTFCQSVRMPSLIRTVTYPLLTTDGLLIFYLTLVRRKPVYASVLWNLIRLRASKSRNAFSGISYPCVKTVFTHMTVSRGFSQNSKISCPALQKALFWCVIFNFCLFFVYDLNYILRSLMICIPHQILFGW
jgi:hypothetical protein